MKFNYLIIVALSLNTCHRAAAEKAKSDKAFNCFAQDVEGGVELNCDGVPHLIKNGKDGAQGPAGRNGGPGAKGDPGAQGPPGTSGRQVETVLNCQVSWEGVPAYEIGYIIFTYSDLVREAVATVETDKNEIFVNSVLWLKEDSRYESSPLDVGGFSFTKTGSGAVVLYRGNGRTSDMSCH